VPSFHYVYILESQDGEGHFYVGMTADLRARLEMHNSGQVAHSSKFRPWRIKTAIAMRDPAKATLLERYLKTSSGHAFPKKHL